MTKRLGVRLAVIATALLCLGVAGYAGQVWWARRAAARILDTLPNVGWQKGRRMQTGPFIYGPDLVSQWRRMSWPGGSYERRFSRNNLTPRDRPWIPRRTFRELLILLTGQDCGNDPAAWEAWFKAHPNLVWNETLKRLVDPKSMTNAP